MTATSADEPAARARPRVVVVGAGLTGLTTGWLLREDADVVVLEADDRVGGQVRTERVAGAPFDVGADAFLARQPEAEELIRALGFGDDDLVAPVAGRVHLWTRGRLRELPAGTVLGAPTSFSSLARSGVLRRGQLLRAAAEPLVPRRQVVGDRSVADLVGERYGRGVVDALVEPLLGGVYAGSVERLSAEATLPPVWAAAREHHSLARGLAAHRQRTAGDTRPVFLTVRGGLQRVTDRLRERLGHRVRVGCRVTRLEVTGDRWRVTTSAGGGVASDDVDAIVLAVPAAAAAALLRDVDADVARELAGMRTASVGVVALAYDPADTADVAVGSGVLVPRGEGRLIKAITISSQKWPHHRDRQGDFLLRASVGRVDDVAALELTDSELAERVDAEVRWALRIGAPARERHVVRWPDALPQYDVGHLARVERIRHAVSDRLPGLHIGGAAHDGVGLTARARDGARLAAEVSSALSRHRGAQGPRS